MTTRHKQSDCNIKEHTAGYVKKFSCIIMTRDFKGDPSIDGLLKMTNDVLQKLKKEII